MMKEGVKKEGVVKGRMMKEGVTDEEGYERKG